MTTKKMSASDIMSADILFMIKELKLIIILN